MHSAVEDGDAEALRRLLANWANTGARPVANDVNKNLLSELLYKAVDTADVATVDELIKAGASCALPKSAALPTPLHACAASLKNYAGDSVAETGVALIMELLISKHRAALAVRDNKGRTPRDVASLCLKQLTTPAAVKMVRVGMAPSSWRDILAGVRSYRQLFELLGWSLLIAGGGYGVYYFVTEVLPVLMVLSILGAVSSSRRETYHVYHQRRPECAIM